MSHKQNMASILRRALCILPGILLLGSLAAAGQRKHSTDVESAPGGAGTHAYDIPLVPDVTAFQQPTNSWTFFFELHSGVKLRSACYIDLNFTASQALIAGEASITVTLNGTPVESLKLGTGHKKSGHWHIEMPLSLFKLGAFNELRIDTRQRSSGGACQDVDNTSNWIKFHDCLLHLVREDPLAFQLYSYPFPYLDTLSTNPIQSTWVLPNAARPTQIAEALGLASDWGRMEPVRGLPIRLTTGGGRPGYNIMVGASAQSGNDSLADNEGLLQVQPGDVPGNSRLLVSGAGDQGLHNARKSLAYPELVSQMRGLRSRIDSSPPEPPNTPTTGIGLFTFSQLGLHAITLKGEYHQHATLTIQRPVVCDLGRNSFIRIHFRHSADLNPLRSILSVVINGIPIGSARLDADDKDGGTLNLQIPISEMSKNVWQIDLQAYHDLASVDCSKSYEEVAWTVIEDTSAFELATGQIAGLPYLEEFPYLVGRDGLAPKTVSISISQTLSEAQLSLAAIIAARAAQMNRRSFDWDVNIGGLPQGKQSSISIGYYDEAQRFGSIANDLLVKPQGNGRFKIDSRLRLLESALNDGAVLQAVRAPGSDPKNPGVMYVLLGKDEAALNKFAELIADPKRAIGLTGEVAVLTGDGHLITLNTVNDQQVAVQRTNEQDRYTGLMYGVMGFIIIVLVGFIIWAGLQFVKRPAK